MNGLSLSVAGVRHRHRDGDRDTPATTGFELAAGGRALLLGPNGAGKTTLLQRIVGLIDGEGEVRIGGERVERRSLARLRRKIGFLWQNPDDGLLLPTVLEDVAFGPSNDGLAAADARAVAAHWLERLDLAHLSSRTVRALSLGEKQLVALAGVLARGPGLVLLDEPTASLDERARARIASVFDGLEATLLLVTHEPEPWLARGAWQVIRLSAGEEDPARCPES